MLPPTWSHHKHCGYNTCDPRPYTSRAHGQGGSNGTNNTLVRGQLSQGLCDYSGGQARGSDRWRWGGQVTHPRPPPMPMTPVPVPKKAREEAAGSTGAMWRWGGPAQHLVLALCSADCVLCHRHGAISKLRTQVGQGLGCWAPKG